MSFSSFSRVKDRSDLDKQLGEYLDQGGQIEELLVDEHQEQKRREIAKALHFSVHHRHYAKHTGLAVQRIKEINKNPRDMTDDEIEKLWSFISGRRAYIRA
ncbi:hypothetical protein NQ651_17845 [Acinetobacter baumannii]|nr:hypothetical protein [Acinetobacter baumannii]